MLKGSASTLQDRIQNYLKLEKLPQIWAQHNHKSKYKMLNKGRNHQWQDRLSVF